MRAQKVPAYLAAGAAVLVLALAAQVAVSHAAMDRHPELKSRAVAWTEYDGSYLFDTSSRAEMLDVFWNVFDKPYGDHGWTGSVNPPTAGTTSERWRLREYAQLNAYRWLNGSPPVTENASKIDNVQAAALVFALNPDKGLTHNLTPEYVGYNAIAADAAATSLLNGTSNDTGVNNLFYGGAADLFIGDADQGNASSTGHRMYLLHDNSTSVVLGSAIDTPAAIYGVDGYANVWNTPLTHEITSLDRFIAYPSPGYFPVVLMAQQYFRWSFVPADDWTEFDVATAAVTSRGFFTFDPGVPARDATVTAKINGSDIPVHNLVRNNPPGPLTWDFGSAFAPITDIHSGATPDFTDGTAVEITIHDVGILTPGDFHVIGYRDYHYTVILFDPTKIVADTYGPQTQLTNISTRSAIGTGDQQMIAGFTVSGTTPVRVAVRTQGPGLTRYGISNAAKSTHIRVYDQASGTLLGENTGWKTHPHWRLMQSLGVAPTKDNEAAEVLTLWPGSYSAVVSDDSGSEGVGIVEVFDIDNLSQANLVNLSTRGLVGQNENQMIAGISIERSPRTVVIRTQGPGLSRFGVRGVVSDTVLSVVAQNDGHTVATNDDWQTDPRNARLLSGGDLANYAPSDAREAAVVLTLAPGAYTALVSAKTAPGVGIVEAFDVTP